jgi:hypothetical protein
MILNSRRGASLHYQSQPQPHQQQQHQQAWINRQQAASPLPPSGRSNYNYSSDEELYNRQRKSYYGPSTDLSIDTSLFSEPFHSNFVSPHSTSWQRQHNDESCATNNSRHTNPSPVTVTAAFSHSPSCSAIKSSNGCSKAGCTCSKNTFPGNSEKPNYSFPSMLINQEFPIRNFNSFDAKFSSSGATDSEDSSRNVSFDGYDKEFYEHSAQGVLRTVSLMDFSDIEQHNYNALFSDNALSKKPNNFLSY